MNVGLMCGSAGVRSSNGAALHIAARLIEKSGHLSSDIGAPADIPSFDPTLADDPPPAVRRFQDRIRESDALLIAAPEYAGGVAGSTKNALDWLVGDATIHRMVIGVASAGTTGGTFAIEELVRTISWQGGWVVATLGIAAPRTKTDEQGRFTDGTTLSQIGAWTRTVLGAVEGPASNRSELVASIVAPYGIDPARFGDFD